MAVFSLKDYVHPFNGNLPAARHRLNGIYDNVVAHLADLTFIRIDVMEEIWDLKDTFNICAA